MMTSEDLAICQICLIFVVFITRGGDGAIGF